MSCSKMYRFHCTSLAALGLVIKFRLSRSSRTRRLHAGDDILFGDSFRWWCYCLGLCRREALCKQASQCNCNVICQNLLRTSLLYALCPRSSVLAPFPPRRTGVGPTCDPYRGASECSGIYCHTWI